MREKAVCFLSCLLMTGYAFGQGNAVVKGEFPFDFDPLPVECVGELVGLSATGYLIYHEFVTPSGRYHGLNNVRFEGVMFSIPSGLEWYVRGTWPVQENAGKGIVVKQAIRLTAQPVDDNPYPALISKIHVRFIVDANGEVRVNEASFEFPSCIGH